MSSKPNIHDILENACEKFGLTMGEAMAITKTPLHPRELRDEFAGQAMQGLLAQSQGTALGSRVEAAAEYAYAMADAMLKARAA